MDAGKRQTSGGLQEVHLPDRRRVSRPIMEQGRKLPGTGLGDRRFCKLRGDQLFVGNPFFKLTGFLQNILEQVKAFLLENGIAFPGILGLVPSYDGGNGIHVCFLKLGLNGFRDFLRRVGINVIQSLLDGTEQKHAGFRRIWSMGRE